MPSAQDELLERLHSLRERTTSRTLAELGIVTHVGVDAQGVAQIRLRVNNPARSRAELEEDVKATARGIEGITGASISWEIDTPGREIGPDDPVPEVRNVVLVMSGKGGVGKSTVAANLALALARMGTKVGLLDADIYGPSIPTLLGITGQPLSDGKRIMPLQRFGIKLMSIGFLLEDAKTAVVWRGPMLHGALMQFLKDVDWGKLDYLILDLPPGTGDVALTLSQRVRTNGAVIVTTPQEVALQDVYKSVSMAKKVGIPIIGIVENESFFVCGKCGEHHELFGKGGGNLVAEMAEAPLLGQIPLHPAVREWGDAGTPVVQAAPGSPIANSFVGVAERVVERLIEMNEAAGSGGLVIDRSGGKNRRLPVAR